jgi:crotonobetainyl-CoA:carnitine CoA-transferase CaiB-like acyl-CoA transferase
MTDATGPLTGTRVIELGQMIAVPTATHILAGYGADVIKVEDTGAGDPLRFFGTQKGGVSGWFATSNSGKRSIGIDLKSDRGKTVLWRLIESADIFIEGFRAGVIDRLGFNYEKVRARCPAIIYCSSSGFGPTGPYADQPVYDPLIQSLSGWAGIQQQDGEPKLVRGMVADKVGAYTNAQAMMAALVKRLRTGEGSRVQVNMLEANINFTWPDVMMDCTLLDDDVDHRPNLLGIYRLYGCSDGWVGIAPGADRHWEDMCAALDRMDLFADDRFKTAAARGGVMNEWFVIIDAMVKPFTVAEVVARLRKAEVPVAPVMHPDQVHTDAQVQAMGVLQESIHPVAGQVRHPRAVSSFFGQTLTLTPAPTHGQHTREILDELGLSNEADALITQAAVFAGNTETT